MTQGKGAGGVKVVIEAEIGSEWRGGGARAEEDVGGGGGGII